MCTLLQLPRSFWTDSFHVSVIIISIIITCFRILCADWKAMAILKGVNAPNANHFCLWCKCTKEQIRDFSGMYSKQFVCIFNNNINHFMMGTFGSFVRTVFQCLLMLILYIYNENYNGGSLQHSPYAHSPLTLTNSLNKYIL